MSRNNSWNWIVQAKGGVVRPGGGFPCSGPLVAHDDVFREVPGAGAGDGAEEFVDVVGVGVAPAVPGGQKAVMDQPAGIRR